MKLAVVLLIALGFACGGKKPQSTTSSKSMMGAGGSTYGGSMYGGNAYGGNAYGGAGYGGAR